MDRAFLEGLGLDVSVSDGGVVEASLELSSGEAVNPLTRHTIERVDFTVVGDRLLYVGPAEFVGAAPINLAFLTQATRLEDLVVQTLNDHLYQLERRSNELTTLGVPPRVDPNTLQLTAELEHPPLRFVISANRTGQFRVLRAFKGDAELTAAGATTFELSEYRDRRALEAFLFAMFSDVAASPARPAGEGAAPAGLAFLELVAAFGDAQLPPRSPLEVLAEVRVGDQVLRFAAARVRGRTFRGLVAGPSGKLWAERFELEEFPGVRALVAQLLGVPQEEVEVLSA